MYYAADLRVSLDSVTNYGLYELCADLLQKIHTPCYDTKDIRSDLNLVIQFGILLRFNSAVLVILFTDLRSLQSFAGHVYCPSLTALLKTTWLAVYIRGSMLCHQIESSPFNQSTTHPSAQLLT